MPLPLFMDFFHSALPVLRFSDFSITHLVYYLLMLAPPFTKLSFKGPSLEFFC